jgi:hypothetical protein
VGVMGMMGRKSRHRNPFATTKRKVSAFGIEMEQEIHIVDDTEGVGRC